MVTAWLPNHLVLAVVLQDRDLPFLLEVHCSALLHVRDLVESCSAVWTS